MDRDVGTLVAFALVAALVAGAVAVPASAVSATADGPQAPQTTNDSAGTDAVAPGQRLMGVVGAQHAELDGELQERTLSTRLSRADSNASKAAVVATDLNRVRDRLERLRERREALREARRTGAMATGEYAARMGIVSAEARALRSQIESNERTTRALPAAALESKGVDPAELDRLRTEADGLRGSDVAEIAREIAGEDRDRNADGEPGPDELPDQAADGGPGDGAPPANGAAGNRSTATDPPGQSGEGDAPGKSGDAGEGDAPGKSGDAGGDEAPGKSGDAGGDEAPGKSGDAGGSDGSNGSDDGPGKSGDVGERDGPNGPDGAPGNAGGGSGGEDR